jgi:hypothetical protein
MSAPEEVQVHSAGPAMNDAIWLCYINTFFKAGKDFGSAKSMPRRNEL